jgi:hypothetical protein
MLSRLIQLGHVMISRHNRRFVTKVLVAAISLVGICAGYLYITAPSENASKEVKTAAIDDMPTASISHFPEERLVIEVLPGGKAKHSATRKIQSRPADKATPTNKVVLKRSGTTQIKISTVPSKKISKGIEANISNPIIQKAAPEQSAKKSPVKKDPIASLLAKH